MEISIFGNRKIGIKAALENINESENYKGAVAALLPRKMVEEITNEDFMALSPNADPQAMHKFCGAFALLIQKSGSPLAEEQKQVADSYRKVCLSISRVAHPKNHSFIHKGKPYKISYWGLLSAPRLMVYTMGLTLLGFTLGELR